MIRILDDYRFDDCLRYESHRLIYSPQNDEPLTVTGILGAAVLAALLVDTDEGEARQIAVDSPAQRNEFFDRYEREVRRDNGGLFDTELRALSLSYVELSRLDNPLPHICRNDRLYDLAIGLVDEYMRRLVNELVEDSIYEMHPWDAPFAQWLYDAAFLETHRQRLLAIDWAEPADVYQLEELLESTDENTPEEPTFFFDGVSSEDIMSRYFNWLMDVLHAQTSVLPDAKVRFAQLRPVVLEQETNWDFIRPQIDQLSLDDRQLFLKWMTEWKDFITHKLDDSAQNTFPQQHKLPNFKQVLFPDTILPCPTPNNYAGTRDYILERIKYDPAFKAYYESHTRVNLCEQLTAMFGWVVDQNHLGKRMNSHKKSQK